MLERNFKKKVQDDLKKQGWVFIQLVADSGIPTLTAYRIPVKVGV